MYRIVATRATAAARGERSSPRCGSAFFEAFISNTRGLSNASAKRRLTGWNTCASCSGITNAKGHPRGPERMVTPVKVLVILPFGFPISLPGGPWRNGSDAAWLHARPYMRYATAIGHSGRTRRPLNYQANRQWCLSWPTFNGELSPPYTRYPGVEHPSRDEIQRR
jgi:hypothetical protein